MAEIENTRNEHLESIEEMAWEIEVLSCRVIAMVEAMMPRVSDDDSTTYWMLDAIDSTSKRVHELSCNIRGY